MAGGEERAGELAGMIEVFWKSGWTDAVDCHRLSRVWPYAKRSREMLVTHAQEKHMLVAA